MSTFFKISSTNPAGVTVFPNATEVREARAQTHRFRSLADVRTWLKESKCVRDEKTRIPLFTRGVCEGNRAKANVRAPLLVILDCDDTPVSPEEAHERLDLLEVDHVLHTTWSHGELEGLHRYRIFVDWTSPGWDELRTITQALFDAVGVEPTPESFTGTAFYVPSLPDRADRRARYRLLSTIGPDGSFWEPPEPEVDARGSENRAESHPEDGAHTTDPDEVRSALERVPNDRGYEHWIRVGAALHSWGHPQARDLWDEWSQAPPYAGECSDAEQAAKWASFDSDRLQGVGLATVFYMARQEGWRPEKREERATAVEDFAQFAHPRTRLLLELNQRYGYVAVGNGRVADLGSPDGEVKLLSTKAFQEFHQLPVVGTRTFARNGDEISKPLGVAWLRYWRSRPSYKAMDFLPPGGPDELPPETLNLWRGWGVEPGPGSCQHYLEHVREVISSGDNEIYEWLLAWMAHLVQRPWEKPKTAVVLRGDEGVGKGLFAEMLLRLVGRAHGLQVTHPRHLTGNFNTHLASKLLVFADEVTWGGRIEDDGVLKALISEERTMVEPKGIDASPARSYCRVVVSSNNEWVVPAGRTARRLLVLDVSDQMRGKTDYFQPLVEEIQGGGPAGLMSYLFGLDLEELPDPRSVIETQALADQKIESLDPVSAWLLYIGRAGEFTHGAGWPGSASSEIRTKDVYDSYVDHAQAQGIRRKRIEYQVSKFLAKVFGEALEKDKQRVAPGEQPVHVYRFPPLDKARSLIARHLKIPVKWDA